MALCPAWTPSLGVVGICGQHTREAQGFFALTGHGHNCVLGQDASSPELLAHSSHQKADFPALTRFEKNNYSTGYDPQISGEENLGQIQRWPCEWQMWCIVLLQLVHNMAQAGKQETEI